MAKFSEVYSGAYLSGADLQGRTHNLTIDRVTTEQVGDDRETKLVVTFVGGRKSWILNKTNGSTLAAAFGDDCDQWSGRAVELFVVPTTFNGRVYDGIRCRAAAPPAAPPAAAEEVPDPVGVPASQTRRAMQAGADEDQCPF